MVYDDTHAAVNNNDDGKDGEVNVVDGNDAAMDGDDDEAAVVEGAEDEMTTVDTRQTSFVQGDSLPPREVDCEQDCFLLHVVVSNTVVLDCRVRPMKTPPWKSSHCSL